MRKMNFMLGLTNFEKVIRIEYTAFGGIAVKFLKVKINTILVMSSIIMICVFFFFDENTLNSMVLQYNNDFMVKEISVCTVNTETSNKEEKEIQVVTNEVVEEPKKEATVTLLSNQTQTDYWVWPTEANYVITSYYGYRWGSMHGAIDISGPGYGSSIYAANSGVVTTVKGGCVSGDTSCNGRGGNYIVIRHNSNNYYTMYMHLKDIKVSVGQNVSRGQVIGTMGNTGNVSPVPTPSNPYNGTHLHFALYIGQPYNGGYAVNPMRLY